MGQRGYGIGTAYPEQVIVKRTCLIQPVKLSPSKFTTIHIETFELDCITVSVAQGTLNVWFGDYSGDSLPLIPHLHFNAIGQPIQIWLPGLGKHVHTVTVGGEGVLDPCLGTIILSGECK